MITYHPYKFETYLSIPFIYQLMKKTVLFIYLLLAFTYTLYGREKSMEYIPKNIIQCLDKVGLDSSAVLSTSESAFLNYFFEKQRGSFSFDDKTVFFLTGNNGAIKSTKNTFFRKIKLGLNIGIMPSQAMQQLLIFDGFEKKLTDYDAVIITGSKKYLTKKGVIKHIKKL